MCLLCQLWAKEFEDRPLTSLQTKHHDPDLDQSNCTSPGPTEFAHFKISGNIMPIVIFGHMVPLSCVRTKLTRPEHSAHEESERRNEANRPSSISGTDVGMYANEPLSGSKSKPLGAVKSALSHGDGDKRFSKPLDFDLL